MSLKISDMVSKGNWANNYFQFGQKKTGIQIESRNISLQLISHDTKVNF
jgi:hypothetical protein